MHFGVEKRRKVLKREAEKIKTAVFRKRNRAKTAVFSAVKLANRQVKQDDTLTARRRRALV